jgi:RNA polymerase sigma-70 factor (ECF subfamily)
MNSRSITKSLAAEPAPMTDQTDEELAALVQQGNQDAFGLLMLRYQPKLIRYGRKFLPNPDNVEDAVQEAFIKSYQNIKSFDCSQKFSSWVYRIAHNTFINAIKKISRGPVYLFDFDAIVSHPIYEDADEKESDQIRIKELIDNGLKTLKPRYREVIILYYLEELSYKEIAEILRIPIGTVGIRIQRAKVKLKKYLSLNEKQSHERT